MSREVHQRRVREMRSRVAVRAWTYRQRRLARGVWARLRRLLVETSEAFVVRPADLDRLLGEGLELKPAGLELEPPKRLVFVDREQLARVDAPRPIPVRLGPDLLQATDIVLVPFEDVP